jgi:hypothetical protein
VIESANKSPGLGPSECLEIQVAYVVENIIVLAGDATNDEELVLMQNGSMSRSTFGNMAGNLWLGPVSRLEIENYKIG